MDGSGTVRWLWDGLGSKVLGARLLFTAPLPPRGRKRGGLLSHLSPSLLHSAASLSDCQAAAAAEPDLPGFQAHKPSSEAFYCWVRGTKTRAACMQHD